MNNSLDETSGGVQRNRDRLHDVVATEIENRILSGDLKIGDKLASESNIAEEFGVSTRSVREAIQILETKGLVLRRHGGRTTVVREDVENFLNTLAVTVRQRFSTDPEYFHELMAVRKMIETEVVQIIIAGERALVPEFTEMLDAMRLARDTQDFSSFVDADARFHLALVHSSGNRIVSLIYDNLFELINEVIQVTSRVPTKSLEAAYAEHEAIYTMIRDRDLDGAKRLLRAQIDNSAAYLRVAIENAQQQNSTED